MYWATLSDRADMWSTPSGILNMSGVEHYFPSAKEARVRERPSFGREQCIYREKICIKSFLNEIRRVITIF